MFDQRIIGRGIIISSSDFVDWALADYMTNQPSVIAQMIYISERQQKHSVLTI